MNNENEAMVEVSSNRNTVRQKMKSFPRKGAADGAHEPKENFPQGEWKKHGIQMLTWSILRASVDLIVQGFVCLS